MAKNTFSMSKKLKCIISSLEENGEKASMVALKSFEGEVKSRIHNQGRDSSGLSIGQYQSEYWKAKRRAAGRQIGYVDLEMTGELRRSLTTGQIRGGAVLGFDSDQEREKYEKMKALYGNVWRPSILEQRNIQERFWNEIKKGMRNC